MNASTNIQRESSRWRTSSVLVTFVAALFAAIGLLFIAVERTDAQTQGEVWAWGGNELGALGDGTNTDSNTPVQVSDLSDVQAVAGGGAYSLALKNDGSVWAWGDNRFGQLGDGTTTNRNTPVQVSDLSGVQAVDGGELFGLALKDDGSVWAWGSNAVGQLGNGAFNQSNTPVQVSGLSGVQAIAAGGFHSMALKNDGSVWAWGSNRFGQLGDGTNILSRNTPVQVSGLSNVQAIAAGESYSMALKDDGSVWAWGNNEEGQLGNGTNTQSNTPVQVSGLSDMQAIAAGGSHSLALKNDGSVWAWGRNGNGQLDDGTDIQSNTPVQVSDLSDVQAVAGGGHHSMALRDDGSVWVWGFPENSTTPVQVSGLSGVQAIAAGGIHSLAIGSFKVKATKEPIRQSLLVDFHLDDEACSGDLIHLTGKLNAVFHLLDDGAGGFHLNTEFNFANVEGIGEPSGGHYRVPTTSTSTVNSHSDGFPMIVTESARTTVIGQGQLPDSTAHLVLHFTIHEDDTVTAEVTHFRSECK